MQKTAFTALSLVLISLFSFAQIGDRRAIESSQSTKIWSGDSINQNKNEKRPLISSEVASSIALNSLQMTATGVELSHPNHHVTFESDGVLFEPKEGPDWKWQLTHIGTEEESLKGLTTQSVQPENNDPRIVSYHYGNIVEEYHAKQNTVEQRFVIEEPLSLDGQDLVIKGHVESQGEFEELKTESEKSWTWSDTSGQVKLGDVTVFDAEGQILMACMNVTAQSTEIIVDAQSLASATYPVTVDPEIGANDFRISDMGPDGSTAFTGENPAVAYNPVANEYLVVWGGREQVPPTGSLEREIFGQRIDAVTGAEVGTNDFRISDMGPEGGTIYFASRPQVAYNSVENQYLVVWSGTDDFSSLPFGEREIFGQLLDVSGNEIGANDFRISDMGPDGMSQFGARDPAIVYNSTENEYLVIWDGTETISPAISQEEEIFGQRISGVDGSEIGVNDFRISDMGLPGMVQFSANFPALAYNPTNNEYLVVWEGINETASEFEIYGQRLDGADGAELGVNDLRISDMGPDGNTSFGAGNPDVTYNSNSDEYLVVWCGEDNEFGLVDGEREVFGQRVDGSSGMEIGVNDFRISDVGPSSDADFDAFDPAVTYNSTDNEYLVIWEADETDGEFEIYGQRLDATTGAERGDNDFRLSDMGPEGTPGFGGFNPDIAVDPMSNEYLIVWHGEENGNLEFEIYGQKFKVVGLTSIGPSQLSLLAGGTQCFTIEAGPDCAGFPYLVLGTTLGTSPGASIDGQTIPLNPDGYFIFTLNNPNSSFLSMSFGLLDANGRATAKFNLPPGLSPLLAGTVIHHAAVVIDPLIIGGILKVTNAVSVLLGL